MVHTERPISLLLPNRIAQHTSQLNLCSHRNAQYTFDRCPTDHCPTA